MLELAPSADPILAAITFDMMPDEIVMVVVGVAAAADEGAIIALEFTMCGAFMLLQYYLLAPKPTVLLIDVKTAIEALPNAAELSYRPKY